MLTRFIKRTRIYLAALKNPIKVKRAVTDPKWALWAIKGRWQLGLGLNQPEFVARLLDTTTENATSMLSQLKSKEVLYQHLQPCLDEISPSTRTLGETAYIIVRLLKPDVVVETGVAYGFSSSLILQAQEDNGKGKLYSIDLPPTGQRLEDGLLYQLPQGKKSGWAIPEDLRHRWHLIIGDSKEKLLPLLEQLGSIDIFLHDSLHTFQHQKWEYETAWPFIKSGGLLLCRNINMPFVKFCDKYGAPYLHYNYLGGIVKR